ncbi:hypothetical protein Dda_2769 [Drechslerella dactyloides]|uniref:Apple domain-containing protein n=1 Tax=Drechslerella dactyloides TaxID=74499 RepID=A0AAD6NM74_DREDA|nr:hypothetical protein Dda_2769 [Drechslerella dactyloides]
MLLDNIKKADVFVGKKRTKTICTVPSTTVRSTVTVKPTITKTETSTLIQTSIATKPGSTETVTITATAFTTEEEKATFTETFYTYESTTSVLTVTITSTAPPEQTCTPTAGRRGINRRASASACTSIPSDCSCLLTQTASSGKVTVKTTITLPTSTVTVKATVTKPITVTTTLIGTTYTDTTTTESTITSYTTLTTSTTIITSTSTSVSTATATVAFDPCASSQRFESSLMTSPNVVVGITSDAGGPDGGFRNCCGNCWSNKDCVFFEVQTSPYPTCKQYYTLRTVVPFCQTQSCQRGVRPVQLAQGSSTFGLGPCAALAGSGTR